MLKVSNKRCEHLFKDCSFRLLRNLLSVFRQKRKLNEFKNVLPLRVSLVCDMLNILLLLAVCFRTEAGKLSSHFRERNLLKLQLNPVVSKS